MKILSLCFKGGSGCYILNGGRVEIQQNIIDQVKLTSDSATYIGKLVDAILMPLDIMRIATFRMKDKSFIKEDNVKAIIGRCFDLSHFKIFLSDFGLFRNCADVLRRVRGIDCAAYSKQDLQNCCQNDIRDGLTFAETSVDEAHSMPTNSVTLLCWVRDSSGIDPLQQDKLFLVADFCDLNLLPFLCCLKKFKCCHTLKNTKNYYL